MTLEKKAIYALTITTAILAIIWNTVALSASSDTSQQGSLVDFEVRLEEKLNEEDYRIIQAEMSIWSDFDKKTTFELSDKFKFNFKISDLNEFAFIDMELIKTTDSSAKEQIIATPSLTAEFGKEATIKIDNTQGDQLAFFVTLRPKRTVRPQ